MATNFSPCKGCYVLNQFPSNVIFGMNGFHVSASGAIQDHHGPLVLIFFVLQKKKMRYKWQMSLVYHEKIRHRQIGITIRQTQKPLTLYQKDSSFMALKEVHIENVKKGGNAGYEHFLLFL